MHETGGLTCLFKLAQEKKSFDYFYKQARKILENNRFGGLCGVRKMRSVENGSVENAECEKCVENFNFPF